MDAVLVCNVIGQDGQHCLPVLKSVAETIPYLQTHLNTKVGEKRKLTPEFEVNLPPLCTAQALDAIIARMSGRTGATYRTYFQWDVRTASAAVALIKTADFLLMPELVTEILAQTRPCFISQDDAAPIQDLPHTSVERLVLEMKGGLLASTMTGDAVAVMCKNMTTASSARASAAAVKVLRQWLYDPKRTQLEFTRLTGVVFDTARDHGPGPVMDLAIEVTKSQHFELSKLLRNIGDHFFWGHYFAKPGITDLSKLVIDCGLRTPNSFGLALKAVFRENEFTQFAKHKDAYLICFEHCFNVRPLSLDEFDSLINHFAVTCQKREFLPLFSASEVFGRALASMGKEHQERFAANLTPGAMSIISKPLLLSLCPCARVLVVAKLMPNLMQVEEDIREFILEAIERSEL